MNDESSRLQMLRFTRRVVAQQEAAALAQIDGWITAEERREAERRRGGEMRPVPPERPPVVEWSCRGTAPPTRMPSCLTLTLL